MWIDTAQWQWAAGYPPAGPPPVPRRPVVDGFLGLSGHAGPWSAGARAVRRARVERYVNARGWRLGRIYDEQDGPTQTRRSLHQALERVELSESQGIVTTSLERIGGSLDQVLRVIERIHAAGAIFVSLDDGLDLATPAGRRTLRLLYTVAEWDFTDHQRQKEVTT
jgi:DNA invertase Pin-like site-specific DNA recombinase